MVADHIGPGMSFTPVIGNEILSFKAEMTQIKFFFCWFKKRIMVADHIGPGMSFTPVIGNEILSFKAEMTQIKFFFCWFKIFS